MKQLLAPLAFVALAACNQAPQEEAPSVTGAWVRLAAVPGRPGAAYFTLKAGSAPIRLLAVDSSQVANVELHSMTMNGGMMAMRPLKAVDVAVRQEARFAPGGNHAMLFGVDPQIKPGGLMPLGFRLADGRRLVASAPVVGAGDPAPGSQ